MYVYIYIYSVCKWRQPMEQYPSTWLWRGGAVGCSELPPLCTTAFPWVLPDACVRSDNEGSLSARLPAVPACMAPTHPFSDLRQAEGAEPFLTRGPASSSSCSLSCRGCSWASSVQTGSQVPSGVNPGATSLDNKNRELVCFRTLTNAFSSLFSLHFRRTGQEMNDTKETLLTKGSLTCNSD